MPDLVPFQIWNFAWTVELSRNENITSNGVSELFTPPVDAMKIITESLETDITLEERTD